jgi:hypothetical protein
MTKITAPAAVPGKVVGVGGLVFQDGVAETDDPAILNYCRDAGYGVGSTKPRSLDAPEAPDPRDLADTVVGTRLRDAAVDPRPEDFLAPTNAGKANPHGPKVVAPQIHASENQAIRPGEVFVEDLAAQDKAESAQAAALLVRNEDVGKALPTFERGDETGPLGLSDPGSVHAVKTGNSRDTETATEPDGSPSGDDVLKGKELDAALDAAGLSKTGTADEKRARLAEHTSA